MSKQIITMLCEGPHDVAFICKLLKSIGYKSNESTKIGDYPSPFNQLLLNEASKSDVSQLNLTELRRNLLPSNVLSKQENFVFLYSLEGDTKKEPRQRLLKELESFISAPGEIERMPKDTTLSIAYFFDADNKGILERLGEVRTEISEIIPEINQNLFDSNGQIAIVSGLNIGVFIFSGEDGETGKLENILLPLMKQGNEESFDAADHFITTFFDETRLYSLRWNENVDGRMEESRSTRARDKAKFDQIKSLLGTVGQLQTSGKSNVVCISDSDYLTLPKIAENAKCKEILEFLTAFLRA